MTTSTLAPATLDDLMKVEGKAELINGRVVHLMASGDEPNLAAIEILFSLREYAKQTGVGKAYSDGIGFALPTPLPNGRQSFSPDTAYYTGPRGTNRLRFIRGTPDFAVEVRSENDYGPAAERDMADKRADYFEAGTRVVCDVDTVAETVAVFRADTPTTPVVFARGQVADAEPAVPGWRLPVDDVFA